MRYQEKNHNKSCCWIKDLTRCITFVRFFPLINFNCFVITSSLTYMDCCKWTDKPSFWHLDCSYEAFRQRIYEDFFCSAANLLAWLWSALFFDLLFKTILPPTLSFYISATGQSMHHATSFRLLLPSTGSVKGEVSDLCRAIVDTKLLSWESSKNFMGQSQISEVPSPGNIRRRHDTEPLHSVETSVYLVTWH